MSQRRKLRLIVAVSTAASFIAAAGAMYFATWRFELATNEAQVDRYSQFVERYINEVVWQDHVENAGMLAADMAREDELRTAVLTADRQALKRMLPAAGRRSAVTSGQIAVLGVSIHDEHGVLVAEHMAEASVRVPARLSSLLAARERNERFERLRYIWTREGMPYLSVVVPIGGLRRITGYLAVHVDPLHALRDLDRRLGVHVAFTSLDTGRTLVELKNYQVPDDAVVFDAAVVARAPDSEPLFRIEMQADATASARTMSVIRIWSFAVLFAVLSLIAGMTVALVLMFSRRMARDEAAAAEAALESRRTEERNADLQRHNEMLRESQNVLQVQNQRFSAAMDNMAHGMCMFDKDRKMVLCNRQYLAMYGLPPELGEPGTPLQKLMEARVASGITPVDQSDYFAAVVDTVVRQQPRYRVNEMRDGRFIGVAYQPMAEGGWVAIHQDVTRQKRAELASPAPASSEGGEAVPVLENAPALVPGVADEPVRAPHGA